MVGRAGLEEQGEAPMVVEGAPGRYVGQRPFEVAVGILPGAGEGALSGPWEGGPRYQGLIVVSCSGTRKAMPRRRKSPTASMNASGRSPMMSWPAS